MTLRLTTAGESHGPALVAIVEGLPAGLVLDREAHRRRPRAAASRATAAARASRSRQDRVEVLAGLRHGRTLGTPLALVVREPRPRELGVGDEPVAARGRAAAARASSRSPCRARATPTWRATLKYGLDDVRDALERASARHTAVHVAAGAVAKAAARARSASRSRARVVSEEPRARVDEAKADRDTVGGVVEVRARGVPPGLGSYASKETRLDARLAAALMGIQAVKGVEIGDGFALAGAARLAGARRDRRRACDRETNRAGGIEGGRLERRGDRRPRGDEAAADADAAAPDDRPRDRRARRGARRAQRHRRGRGARGRRRGGGRVRARPRRAREVRRRRARRLRRRPPRVPRAHPVAAAERARAGTWP